MYEGPAATCKLPGSCKLAAGLFEIHPSNRTSFLTLVSNPVMEIRRFHGMGLRHLLPVVFTALYIVLIQSTWREELDYRQRLEHARTHSDESDEWDTDYRTPHPSVQWALGISLPAVSAAVAILMATAYLS